MGEQLLWGVKNGDIAAVKEIVEKGVDVNADLMNGRMALHYAADYGHADVLEYLLSKGAKIDLPDKHGITAILAAIYEGHEDCVKLLVDKVTSRSMRGTFACAHYFVVHLKHVVQ